MPKITFREGPGYRVFVFADGQAVYSHQDYSGAAVWAQRKYGLTEAQLYAIYDDYKDSLE